MRLIARGELRFGERLPNPFAEGETTVWFHMVCAAYKRPEPFLQALQETPETVPNRDELERIANTSLAQRRRPRIDGAERAPSGQARCRNCHEPIGRGKWRIRLAYFQDGRFTPGGFIHLECRITHFETDDVLEQVLCFSPDLNAAERDELRQAFASKKKN
jgi:hypothetical protein